MYVVRSTGINEYYYIFIKFYVKSMVRALYTVSDETVLGQDSAGCDVTDYQLPPQIPFPLSSACHLNTDIGTSRL